MDNNTFEDVISDRESLDTYSLASRKQVDAMEDILAEIRIGLTNKIYFLDDPETLDAHYSHAVSHLIRLRNLTDSVMNTITATYNVRSTT